MDIVIPAYNEEQILEKNVKILRAFIKKEKVPYQHKIIISDNCSTDNTQEISKRLSKEYSDVEYLYVPMKGRGIALKTAWMLSKADVVCFIDADLPADFKVLSRMINEVLNGYDVCLGSKLLKESIVTRSLRRKILSRGYNLFLKMLFLNKFSDAQCGIKTFKGDVIRNVLPLINSQKWFFDTELLLRLERAGYKIKDIPYTYKEDPNSSVKVINICLELFTKSIMFRIKLWKEALIK